MAYTMSKDYEYLYRFICGGGVAVGFCNYTRMNSEGIFELIGRDVCKIEKRKDFDISIGVRGIGYAGIMPFEEKHGIAECEMFRRDCLNLDLEFIDPSY
jgi:hypothetical protein|tara:strand:- start:249 stop:545 length:297 start_codon:yes stop_codon:yes gene_type:complete